MSFIKIFKLAQKGSKKVKGSKGKGGGAPATAWPEGIRVGVFGHENSGKTVYFTALYTKGKTTKNFSISVRDGATGNEFFKSEMAIKGVSVDRAGEGTVAAKTVPRKFPELTTTGIVLQFTAILDGKMKIPVVTYDYSGKAASISEHSDEAEKIREFMADADGLLFFFDSKILAADPEVQARAQSFVNILEFIVPLKARLPIPVGLVITKADTLPGFDGEDKTVLVRAQDEQVIAEDYDTFLERVLGFESLAANREWASSVRNILVKLREFIRVVVGRTLDFQIFFVSSTGSTPEKISVTVGRSLYAPPEKFNPCGVTEPFHWILKSIVRSRRLGVLRKIAACIAVASLGWIALYSLPFAIHFGGLLRAPYRLENALVKEAGGNRAGISDNGYAELKKAYWRYKNDWLVKRMFPEYKITADRMWTVCSNLGGGSEVAGLDSIIVAMTKVVADPNARPKFDKEKNKLILDDIHKSLLEGLGAYHTGDETSVPYLRSGRALESWKLFESYLMNPDDPKIKSDIESKAQFNLQNAQSYGKSEEELNRALVQLAISMPTSGGAGGGGVQANLAEYEELKAQINHSTDPVFVLDEAPEKLKDIRGRLATVLTAAQNSSIQGFLSEVEQWKKRRPYVCRLQAVPPDCHLHIEVTPPGKDPAWSTKTQLLQGDRCVLEWQPGDVIHIAFDEGNFCNWGNPSSDQKVLQEKYALFDMQGQVDFSNVRKTVTFSFPDGLKEKLPKLK